jgi:hypothetical protein
MEMKKGRGESALKPTSFWSSRPLTMTAERDLEAILGSVTGLPLLYWKERMFFRGLPDRAALNLSEGRFPAGPIRGTHPVFSLQAQPDGVGFRVCPCSSKRPYHADNCRYIRKGCRLLYTSHTMDRSSYLVEKIPFNIPRSMATELRFMGQVPEDCIGHERGL